MSLAVMIAIGLIVYALGVWQLGRLLGRRSREYPPMVLNERLVNGRRLQVLPLLFDRARLTIGHPQDPRGFDDEW